VNKLQKIILTVIILLLLILILFIVAYNKVEQNIKTSDENYVNNQDNVEVKLLDNYNQYYTILSHIKQFYTNIEQKKQKEVYSILEKNYIQNNNITIENVLDKLATINVEQPYYNVQQIYMQDTSTILV